MSRIDIELLPEAFLDTVLLCHKVGFRYLWIDALCILQDNEKDWAIEASKMSAEYSMSSLTLAATTASGVNVGFLNGPDTGAHPSLSWNDPDSARSGHLYLRSRLEAGKSYCLRIALS